MKNIERYLELPFENIEVSKEKICYFFESHESSLSYWVDKGMPFSDLLAPTTLAVSNLRACIGEAKVSITQQKATTFTTDECRDMFVSFAKKNEAYIKFTFGKESAEYLEFYPQGLKPFNNITKKTINALMDQQLMSYKKYIPQLSQAKYDEILDIVTMYKAAHTEQAEKKTETKDKQYSWDDYLAKMKDQAFINLLTIAKEFRGQPEKIKLFFDTSLITPHKPKQEGDSGYVLSIPPLESKVADISFSPDDKLLISNNSNISVFYYGAATADEQPKTSPIEITAGDEAEVTALSLGAPANKFLIFVNKDNSLEAEVEIMLIS